MRETNDLHTASWTFRGVVLPSKEGGDPPPLKTHGGRTCLTFARTREIALAGEPTCQETLHLQQCADCEGRHRAFRRRHGVIPLKPFDFELKRIVDTTNDMPPNRSLGPAMVESYARLVLAVFTTAGEDEETELWKEWRGTHVIARAVHHARKVALPAAWIATMAEACVMALLFAVLQVKRRWTFDTAWPIVECLGEGAAAVSATPQARQRYALAYARFVLEAPDPIRGLLIWRLTDIAHRPGDKDDVAFTVVEKLGQTFRDPALDPIIGYVIEARPALAAAAGGAAGFLLAAKENYAHVTKEHQIKITDLIHRSQDDEVIAKRLWSVLAPPWSDDVDPNAVLLSFIASQQGLRNALLSLRDAEAETRQTIVARFRDVLARANDSCASPFMTAAVCENVRRVFPDEWAAALETVDPQLTWQQRQALIVTSAKTCEFARMAAPAEPAGLLPCTAAAGGEAERCNVWFLFEHCAGPTQGFAPHMEWMQERFASTAPAACPQWTPVYRETTGHRAGTGTTDDVAVRTRPGGKGNVAPSGEIGVHPS